jgi:capsular polysaccharide biosynthesis protein
MNLRLPGLLRPLWPWVKRAYTLGTRLVSPITALLSRLHGGYLPRRAVKTVEEVVERGEAEMATVMPEQTVIYEMPIGLPPQLAPFREDATEALPRVAVAELANGRVLGPSRAVITAAGTMIEELSPYFGTTRASEHPLHLHPFPGPPAELEGRIGVLAGRGDWSYFHFLFDILPRLEILDRYEAAPVDRWYVPTGISWQRELLEMMELPFERVIDSDELPHVRAESLVVPTFPDINVRIPPWVIDYLRQRLLPAGLEPVPGRRIYISRGQERHTRCVRNEREILEVLEAEGFVVADPAAHSMAEEIRIYAEAECVVSPHGGALANLIFASRGASVVELISPGFLQTCYWKLADRVGLQYRYVLGEGRIPRDRRFHKVARDITVDVDALRQVLRELPGVATGRA